MTLARRLILAFALFAGIAPAMAQVPSPVPALPDTERRTSYSITGTTCACAVNMALYGDSTDYQNWVEVFLNGTRVNYNDATFGWKITSPSGSLGFIALPITNAVLTFNSVQTGTVQIVGARRPRRTSQFQENLGVPTRNFNLVFSDLTAQNRETFDKINDMTGRGIFGVPGETLNTLPPAGARANQILCFDSLGNIAICNPSSSSSVVTSSIPAVAIESKSGGCGVADNTAALLAAAASVTGPVRVLFPNNCSYNFTQANAINFTKAVYLEGTGQFSTQLQYQPSGSGTFLQWSNGLGSITGGGINNLSLYSSDTTFTKVMVQWYDVSSFDAHDLFCAGGAVGVASKLQGGAGSQCLYSHGRDLGIIYNNWLQAEIPLRLGMNPHSYLSLDHYQFSHNTLTGDLGSGTHPVISADPGVVPTNTSFDHLALQGGTTGFTMPGGEAADAVTAIPSAGSGYTAGTPVTLAGGTCSTPITILPLTVNGGGGILTAAIANPGVCSVTPTNPVSAASGGATVNLTLVAPFNLSFSHGRSEQGVSNSSYTFSIQPAAQLQTFTVTDFAMDSFRCGAFLKNTLYTTIQQSTYLLAGGGCGVAVNATAANGNDMLRYIQDFWLTGVTQNVSGMNEVSNDLSPTGTSATVPPSALYSSTTAGTEFGSIGVSGSIVHCGANGCINLAVPSGVSGTQSDVWGSVAGTISTSATSPIVENATTGAMSCPTCLVSGGALGTPASGVATNLTGTAAGLTAGHVTTNANSTGDVTSVGNATTLAASARLASKAISTTYNLATASGTQAVTGVGFQPTSCILFSVVGGGSDAMSFGLVDSALNQNLLKVFSDALIPAPQANAAIMYQNSAATASQSGVISAYGSDGFTITWTKVGSPTGTLTIYGLCFR